MAYLWLLIGSILLYVGGEFLVKGSVALALRLKVSSLVIGLTVMAFATSAPELLVSLQAALNNHPDMALGNVFGSNIANFGLILGLIALLFGLPAKPEHYRLDWYFLIATSVLVFFLLASNNQLGFWGGAILVAGLIWYTAFKIRESRKATKAEEAAMADDIDPNLRNIPIWKTALFLLLGLLGLRFGADFFVEGASGIALTFGVSERVIAVSVVAVGTSIPELVASIIAARRNEKEMAVANLIGSNIFNLMAVLGITALITPINVLDGKILTFDFWWMLALSVIVFPMMLYGKRGQLGRTEGVLLLLGYAAYIIISFL